MKCLANNLDLLTTFSAVVEPPAQLSYCISVCQAVPPALIISLTLSPNVNYSFPFALCKYCICRYML